MKFSYNWLQSFFKQKLPEPQKLADLINTRAFEVEGVEKIGNDFVLDVKILPNRGPDCFSHLGLAREIAAIKGWDFLSEPEKSKPLEENNIKAKDFLSVQIKDSKACPRYSARVIKGVKVASSPKWLRERLESCGLRPINNIVDITNYVMLETGQPLHAFDGDLISEKKIIVRFAQNNEKIVTLDGEKYNLDSKILVIADAKKPIAIAGIKGGKGPSVEDSTSTVVLEAANFDQHLIRTTSKKIDLKTDASQRFETGLDANLTESAINRASQLIQEIAGGLVCQGLLDFYPKKTLVKKIKLDLDYVSKLLGVEIKKKEAIEILNSLGFKVSAQLVVEVPTRRLDVSIQEDLIEEIGRIYGYENLKAQLPLVSLIMPERNLNIFWENFAKNTMKAAGFVESYNDSFISEETAELFCYKKDSLFELESPPSLDFKYLRPSLIPNLLKNISKNIKYENQIKIFELGKVFKKEKAREKRMISAVLLGNDFYQMKGFVDALLLKLGLFNVRYEDSEIASEDLKTAVFKSKKYARIKAGNEEIGSLGQVSEKVLEYFKINQEVVLFDIDFEKLSSLALEEKEYRPISKYPLALRDVALLVPQQVKIDQVLNVIETAGGKILSDVELFDIYEGKEVPEGKKSLAFRLIFQAPDRTLSSKEIDVILDKIIKNLEAESEWEVRK